MMSLFEELILISLGKQDEFSKQPSSNDWKGLLEEAKKQSVVGVLLSGIERLSASQRPPELTLMAWFGYTNIMVRRNKLLDKRAAELAAILKDGGFSSCILKGQGVARLYPQPERRQCGDIDAWVIAESEIQPDRYKILSYLKKKKYHLGRVVVHHVDADIFEDVPVEIHFSPCYAFSPFRFRKYNQIFKREAKRQCLQFDEQLGFSHPTNEFNAVFSMMHIFKHLYHEGIGLRQLMDYYYILMVLSDNERKNVMGILKWLGLKRFTAVVMYVQQKMFHIDSDKMLCAPSEKYGKVVLEEIIRSGNFGHYDERMQVIANKNLIIHGWVKIKRMATFFQICPSEVLWALFWKVWHFLWRMQFSTY